MNFAYLVDSGKVYLAKHPTSGDFPTSAVVRLIQGVYSYDPKNALRIVRNRIFTTARATEMCHGMVKVAAKRLTECVSRESIDEVFSRFPETSKIDVSESVNALSAILPYEGVIYKGITDLPLSDEKWMEVARGFLRPGDDLPVAALLISHENRVLGASINSNSENRTLHAEINLVQSFYRKHQRKIPPGAKIITTLKPCKMCAGMIWTQAEEIESIQVLFGQMDNGSYARETVLNLGSFERKRASRNSSQLNCEIERQI